MKKLILLLLFVCSPVWATDHFVCSYGGNDANDGLTNTTPKATINAVGWTSWTGGDRLLLCAGGVWTGQSVIQPTDTGWLGTYSGGTPQTDANSIVLDTYVPPSGCDSTCAVTRPSVTCTPTTCIAFAGTGSGQHTRGGYVIRGWELIGPGYGTGGQGAIRMNNGVWDVIVDNVKISNFAMGIYCTENGGFDQERFKVINSTFTGNGDGGTLWDCSYNLFENNLFDNNGFNAVFSSLLHNGTYFGSTRRALVSTVVRHNTYINGSNQNSGTSCLSSHTTHHYSIDGMVYENNLFYEDVAPGNGCYIISFQCTPNAADNMRNIVIRGNTIVNPGGVAISLSCVHDVIVENNVVIQTFSGHGTKGVQVNATDGVGSAGGVASNVKIRNNTFYFAAVGDGGTGINGLSSTANDIVANNATYFGAGVSAPHYCYQFGSKARADIAFFDYNLCYNAGTNFTWSTGTTLGFANLAAAQAGCPGTGLDCNGSNSDPNFTTPADPTWYVKAQSGTDPTVNAGSNTYGSRLSIKGYPKISTRDIGAYEYGSNP